MGETAALDGRDDENGHDVVAKTATGASDDSEAPLVRSDDERARRGEPKRPNPTSAVPGAEYLYFSELRGC
jgi:hypothetical protein